MFILDRKKLKETRRGLNLTQEKLAELVGTTDRNIRYIENGTSIPSLKMLRRICDRLNLSMESVIITKEEDEENARRSNRL